MAVLHWAKPQQACWSGTTSIGALFISSSPLFSLSVWDSGISAFSQRQSFQTRRKAVEDTSVEAHLQHCFFPLCSGCRRIPFQRYRHAQLVCQLRGHLISYEYCQGLLCLFSVFYFFCTGKRVPRPVHQTSWRIEDCFSSVVRSLFLVFARPSLAANRPIPHCSLRIYYTQCDEFASKTKMFFDIKFMWQKRYQSVLSHKIKGKRAFRNYS